MSRRNSNLPGLTEQQVGNWQRAFLGGRRDVPFMSLSISEKWIHRTTRAALENC